MTTGKTWTCTICGLEFLSQQGYASHQKKHKPKVNNPSKVWQCQHCGIFFGSSQGYASHQKKHKNRRGTGNLQRDPDLYQQHKVSGQVRHDIAFPRSDDITQAVEIPMKDEFPNYSDQQPNLEAYEAEFNQSLVTDLEANALLRSQLEEQLSAHIILQQQLQQQIAHSQMLQAQLTQVQAQNNTFKQLFVALGPQVSVLLNSVLSISDESPKADIVDNRRTYGRHPPTPSTPYHPTAQFSHPPPPSYGSHEAHQSSPPTHRVPHSYAREEFHHTKHQSPVPAYPSFLSAITSSVPLRSNNTSRSSSRRSSMDTYNNPTVLSNPTSDWEGEEAQ